MNFYEFASNSPWLTFFLTWLTLSSIVSIVKAIFHKEKKPPMIAKD